MTSVTKPDMSLEWARTGTVVKPSDIKIEAGWIAEKPPFQTFNWINNRADKYLQHLDERGTPEYDSLVIYSIGSEVYSSEEMWVSLGNSNLGNTPIRDGGFWIPKSELHNPVGIITPYAGSGTPLGWAQCNGAAISRTTFARLFLFIGTVYGNGDGSTTFNLPNLVNRSIMGAGSIVAIAGTIGGQNTTLSISNMPSHNHTGSFSGTPVANHEHNLLNTGGLGNLDVSGGDTQGFGSGVSAGKTEPAGGHTPDGSITVNPNGSGSTFSNMQPPMGMNYILKT